MKIQRSQWKKAFSLKPLLKKAKKLFPTVLEHVDPSKVFLCSFTKRKSPHIANIRPIKPPWTLKFSKYDYVISFWYPMFERQDHAYQLMVVVHELLHIPDHGHDEFHRNYRKVVKHDIEDFSMLMSAYGIQCENTKDILKGEEFLLGDKKKKINRFPRILKIK